MENFKIMGPAIPVFWSKRPKYVWQNIGSFSPFQKVITCFSKMSTKLILTLKKISLIFIHHIYWIGWLYWELFHLVKSKVVKKYDVFYQLSRRQNETYVPCPMTSSNIFRLYWKIFFNLNFKKNYFWNDCHCLLETPAAKVFDGSNLKANT